MTELQQFPVDISGDDIFPQAQVSELVIRATAATKLLLGTRKHQRKGTARKADGTTVPMDMITKKFVDIQHRVS